jgi:soluble lytic murein transglycosylase-like protein
MKRLFKITLVFVTFFSVPSLFKNRLIALTVLEKAPNNKLKTEPLQSEDTPYGNMISAAGAKYGVDPELIRLVIGQESRFQPNARSHKNAQGLMQLIPETAQRFGIKNPYDPQQNINGGTRYLSWLLNRFDGDVKLALAGYNAGENAVKRYGNKVPPYRETMQYVNKITAAYGSTYHAVPVQKKLLNRKMAIVQ